MCCPGGWPLTIIAQPDLLGAARGDGGVHGGCDRVLDALRSRQMKTAVRACVYAEAASYWKSPGTSAVWLTLCNISITIMLLIIIKLHLHHKTGPLTSRLSL